VAKDFYETFLPAINIANGKKGGRKGRKNKGALPAAEPPRSANSSQKALRVISAVMNNLVVQVMNNKGKPGTANDKFIDAYFGLYRLLRQVAEDHPQLVQDVDRQIQDFVRNPNKRSKNNVANLGDWLVLLLISTKHTWADVAVAFVAECDTRNVFWYAVGNYQNAPRHPELRALSYQNADRADKVYQASVISRSLVCFQRMFVDLAKQMDVADLDARNGQTPDATKAQLKDLYKVIEGHKGWDDYFQCLGMPTISRDARAKQLHAALAAAVKAGYIK
jgi:hypothetical protein